MFLSNIVALFLAVAIFGTLSRGKRGPLITLIAVWLLLMSFGLVRVAGETTVGQMSDRKLIFVAIGGIGGVLLGLGLFWLGATLFTDDLVMRRVKVALVHRRNRHRANLELAVIDGELSDARAPAAPMYRTDRFRLEPVEFDSNLRDFPERRPTS